MIQIKNAAELEKMRKAAAISAAALKAGGEAIEPGITTAEIDKIIYDFIVRHGARPNFLHLYGFPATACISVNDTVIHGIPSRDQKIRPGDIVSIDTGCKIDGFNGDNACTFACGKLDLEAQRLLDVTKESLHLGIAAALMAKRWWKPAALAAGWRLRSSAPPKMSARGSARRSSGWMFRLWIERRFSRPVTAAGAVLKPQGGNCAVLPKE